MKSALENKDSKTKNKAEEEEELRDHIKNYKSSIQEMNSIIELKTVRLEEVEGSSRKLMD